MLFYLFHEYHHTCSIQEVLTSIDPSSTTATTGQKRTTGNNNVQTVLTEPVVPPEGTSEMDAVDLSMALRKLQVRTFDY